MNTSISSLVTLALVGLALSGAQIACGGADPSGDSGPAPVLEPGTVAPAAMIAHDPGGGNVTATCGSNCYDAEIACFYRCNGTAAAIKACFSNCEAVAKTCSNDCPIE